MLSNTRSTPSAGISTDLFGDPTFPAGFVYREQLFSAADEAAFIQEFEKLPLQPFDFHGYQGNRRVASFGFKYDYGGQILRPSAAMPEFLTPLRQIASQLSGVPELELRQALVSEYAPGAGIGWHRDKPMFDTVIALSFCEPCVLRLRQKSGAEWSRANAPVAPRSGYILRDDVRENWEHSIVPMDRLRYSVTFRTFRSDFRMPTDC